MDRLQNFGYLKLLSRKTLYLDIKWSSFEDYLTSLGRNARHNIRKQIKNFKKSEAIIEEASEFKEFSETFSDLYSNLFSKYNQGAKNPYTASFFLKLYEYARDKTEVFVAKRNGEIVGFCFCLRQGDILDCFICGFNYDTLKRAASVYFNIGYYAPISWAIKEGIKRIHYRMVAEEVKLRRGCQPEEAYELLRCQNRLIGLIFQLYTKIRSRSANKL
jgi:predicted N-acyltransferase